MDRIVQPYSLPGPGPEFHNVTGWPQNVFTPSLATFHALLADVSQHSGQVVVFPGIGLCKVSGVIAAPLQLQNADSADSADSWICKVPISLSVSI